MKIFTRRQDEQMPAQQSNHFLGNEIVEIADF